ncbi:hypothetical protein ILYODFUR_033042 [Ilyodon furcidens]|uniref:Uncharacterized protein n=1 Tax=Ilyodon furcidens TaxID=33524 RepID=A0ABV0TQ08_9TELE
MPKAPCTTCEKMVPLQALPFHIKSCIDESIDLDSSPESESCNPDHMPPLSTESQTKMTAECPVCRGVFDIDTIETHASDCGICSSDKEDNVGISSAQICSFQSSDEILNWISCWMKAAPFPSAFQELTSLVGECNSGNAKRNVFQIAD